MKRRSSRLLVGLAAVVLLAVTLAACGSSSSSNSTTGSASASAPGSSSASGSSTSQAASSGSGKHYTFVVSNNFLGNDYRPELLKEASLSANDPPFAGKVTVKVVESQPTAAAQLADLNNIISEHPDAILLEPPDPTSVNPAIRRACAAGIVVIDVDQAATEPCAYTVAENFYTAQYVLGEWMAHELNGKGSVFLDEGLPGPDISKTILNGFKAGLASAGPNIKVAGSYSGQFANAPSQQAVSSLLVGNKAVNGIMNDGYCSPVFNALKSAGVKPVPTTCYAYNGEIQFCVQNHYACGMSTGAPTGIQIAMKTALDILEGKAHPPKNKVIPNPEAIVVTDASTFHPAKTFGLPIVQMKVAKCGTSVPPLGTGCSDLPAGIAMPFTLSQYPISGKAVSGK
jgi:ribose transport system substrate-binding protein